MANIFEKILDKTAKDMPTPPLVPVGTYLASVEPGWETTTKNDSDVLDHKFRLLQPFDDVDMSEYPGAITGAVMRYSFWITDKDVDEVRYKQDMHKIKTFYVDHLGLDGTQTFRQWLSEAAGRQCLVTVKHVPSKDGTMMYANIAKTAKA